MAVKQNFGGKGKGRAESSRGKTREVFSKGSLRTERKLLAVGEREARRKHIHQSLEELTYDLRERVKELNCLYSISSIVERKGISLEEILQGTVDVIPDAWQYPEITCSRIALENQIFLSANFKETPWRQVQQIVGHGNVLGSLEVFYLEQRPDKDEGPFLKEERSLINVIAGRIGEIIERKLAEEALQESEAQKRVLLSAIPDLMFQVNRSGTLIAFHEGGFGNFRSIGEDLLGKNIYLLSDERRLIPKRILERVMTYVNRTLATEWPQIFEQHVSIGGKGRDFEIQIVMSRADEALGMVRDITVRKRLEREILEISGREQRRIGQDLHDGLCQHLAGVGFLAKALERKAQSGGIIEAADVAEVVDLLDQAITLTRRLARGLNPVRLESDGLMHALSELAANARSLFGIACLFECDDSILVDDNATATHLYRIAQEALNNAIKHGKADRVIIRFARNGNTTTLTVEDNGMGLANAANHGGGMGLSIMNYRASMVGASLDIRNGRDGGAQVICSLQERV